MSYLDLIKKTTDDYNHKLIGEQQWANNVLGE